MLSPLQSAAVVHFGPFELDVRSGELRSDGRRQRLQSQPAQLLALLVGQAGELVTREQLRAQLWPDDTFVDFDHGLNNAVNRIREALGDSAVSPRYVETVPRRGYRFVAKIESRVMASPAPEVSQNAPVRLETLHRQSFAWIAAVTIIFVFVAATIFVLLRNRAPSPAVGIQAIAVLPFANLSADPSQEYFVDGVSDQLITDLARVPSLHVISRTSTLQYRGTRKTSQQIAHELGIDALIEGSVIRVGNRVRITAQLIDARRDRHLWAESYDRDLQDVLAVQSRVAIEIAQQVNARIAPDLRRLEGRGPVNSAAYDAYLLGRYSLTRQNSDAMKQAVVAFEHAIELDPTYASAYSGLADAWSLLANYRGATPQEAFPKSEDAARRALQLDSSLADAHASLGLALHHFEWDWPGAEREYKSAIQSSPSDSVAHLRYAELLSTLNRHDEAVREIARAQELDPNSIVVAANVSRIFYWARRYDECIDQSKRVIELDPGRLYSHVFLGMAYEAKGMYADSQHEFEQAAKLNGGAPGTGVAHLMAVTGRGREAQGLLRSFKYSVEADWYHISGVYAALGQKDQAFAALENAFRLRDFFVPLLNVDPWMDPLRSDARFKDILRRLRLEPGV